MPYVAFGLAAAVVMIRRGFGHPLGFVELCMWSIITALILLRQYLMLADNRRLLGAVEVQQEQLASMALTDPVTGLFNRVVFAERVGQALARHEREGRSIALCWIDIDDFKVINDTYGHAAGDELLRRFSVRIRETLRTEDTLARLGGDEFGVLLEDARCATAAAQRVLDAAEDPFTVAGTLVRVPVSIGVTVLAPQDGCVSAEEFMSRADIAMYAAKARGKNCFETYSPGMTMPGAFDVVLRDPLRAAVAGRRIEVQYQPVCWIQTGKLRGFEALARWSYQGNPISPERFIALAEKLGLACQLGDHILETALAQLAQWNRRRGRDDLVVAVNLSPDQLLDIDLPARVQQLTRRYAISAHQLVLEITERALLTDDPRAMAVADRLVELGVTLSLDDFGTGYSSLAHLRGFPLASLKLDRSFLADIDTDPRAQPFLRAVVRLAKELGLRVIGEGVERDCQLDILRRLGCQLVQGYLLSPPRPAAAFDELVADPAAVCQHLTEAVPAPRERRKSSAGAEVQA